MAGSATAAARQQCEQLFKKLKHCGHDAETAARLDSSMALRGFRSAGHAPSLIAGVVHFDVSFMAWVLLGALGAYIAEDLGLSPMQKGLMVAVPSLGGSVFRLVLGPLADRVGIKSLGLITLALTTIPLVAGALIANSYPMVLVVGTALGVAGASFAVVLPLASRWYPPEYQGLALGIAGAGNSGTVIAALVAPRLAEHVGWHGVFAIMLVPVFLAGGLFAILAKEPPAPPEAGRRGLLDLLTEADARWLCVFYAVTFGGFVGLSSYLSIFFVDRFDLNKVTGATFAAICAIAGSLLRPLGGALGDRFDGLRVLTVTLGAVAALAAMLALLPDLAVTTAVLFTLLGLLGMGNGAVFQVVGVRMRAHVGTMTGLVGAAGGIGGFALPFLFGSLRGSTGTFATGFVMFAIVAASTSVAVLTRYRRWSPAGAVAMAS